MIKNNNFDFDDRYNLFRTVGEILHPTISKKNISNYNIILEEYLYPVRVYYPKKVSNIKDVIIFIHGDSNITGCTGKYSDICRDMAVEVDKLIIAIDYDMEKELSYPDFYEKMYLNLTYLYSELEAYGVLFDRISLMGDSTAGNLIYYMNVMSKEKGEFSISKNILFYPTFSNDYSDYNFNYICSKSNDLLFNELNNYFTSFCNKEKDKYLSIFVENNYSLVSPSLIFVAKTDLLKDECFKVYSELNNINDKNRYVEFSFSNHGFLKSMDKDIKKEVYNQIIDFCN